MDVFEAKAINLAHDMTFRVQHVFADKRGGESDINVGLKEVCPGPVTSDTCSSARAGKGCSAPSQVQ